MTRITFVGDIASDRPLLKAARKYDGYDFSRVFKTDSVFAQSDFVVGNLETCFGGGKQFGYKPYHYNSPDSFCDAIVQAGIDLVSTANNHCMDEGTEGLARTNKILDRKGLLHTGTFSDPHISSRYIVQEINSIKVGFYSLTYSVNTCYEASSCDNLTGYVNLLAYHEKQYSKNAIGKLWQTRVKPELKKVYKKLRYGTIINQFSDKLTDKSINKEWLIQIDQQIQMARKESQVLCILLHIGGQFNTEPGDFSKYMVNHLQELGADIIVGHHPHTLQKIEIFGGKVVAYSLGGFCLSPSGEYLVKESLPEYSAALHVDLNSDGSIGSIKVDILKCVEDPDHYVHVIPVDEKDTNNEAIRSRIGI